MHIPFVAFGKKSSLTNDLEELCLKPRRMVKWNDLDTLKVLDPFFPVGLSAESIDEVLKSNVYDEVQQNIDEAL
jgi:hypothetical protein